MSEGERKLVDASADYLYAVRNGQPVPDPGWQSCRLVLTNERLVLSTGGGSQSVPHSKITVAEDTDGLLPGDVEAAGATPLRIGDNLLLVDPMELDDFESEYCRATLHGEVILAKSPAKVGGVIQDDAGWSKAQFRFDGDRVTLRMPEGRTVSFPIDDVGTLETRSRPVTGEKRRVVEVEHTDAEGRSVETHFSGKERHASALESLLRRVIEERSEGYELSDEESQVLMALYSGVSPFEMSEFVGIDVEEVEEIYAKLLEVGAVDKVRERTEVTLNAQGRNLASEAMNEQ